MFSRLIAQVDPGLVQTLPQVDASKSDPLTVVIQIVFAIIGVVALIYIIIAGVTLIMSNGDSNALNKSKNTIIYAAVGLAIAISAETIVALVVNRL